MVFKTYNAKEQEKLPDEQYVCECGHIVLVHGVMHDSVDHRLPFEVQCSSPCSWCECPKYHFQLKTNFEGWMKIIEERRESWRIKKENWDKDIDKEIGV